MLASNNVHKLREFRQIYEPLGFTVLSPNDLGLALEVEEEGETFGANAMAKAEAFRDAANCLALADDSGLVVDALGGEPGVLSARYGGSGLDDAGRTALVLARMTGVSKARRTACFVAAIAVAAPDCATWAIEEGVGGYITHRPAGEGGFGYDPIFFYPPFGRTFAQLDAAEKGAVSHRGNAARRVAALLAGGREGYT